MPEIVRRTAFGTLNDSTSIELLTIRNAAGVELGVINYGCIIVSLSVPDSSGRIGNVVLGHARLEPYLESSPYFGALVGRYANRIANASFSIDGHVHHLSVNESPNHVHGGFKGFDKHVWQAEAAERSNAVVLRRTSADGEEGYPGRLDVEVTYSISDHNDLWMECRAETDAPTHVNLTQHTYFNLRGEGDVLSHGLAINANTYLPIDAHRIPTGELAPVANTPFDFQEPSEIGARIRTGHEQLMIGGGYDHNFILNRGEEDLALAARVFDRASGRTLEISTTEPGLQFYSGQVVGHGGLCLEPQHFPDSPNRPEFPSTLLRPEERYRTLTRYAFGVTAVANRLD